MKIFFSASVSRDRSLLPVTQNIVTQIEDMGHEVVNKHLVDPTYANEPMWDKKDDPKLFYDNELERLKNADLLITECTTPSFGAAFFIDHCLEMGKPLLSLHYGYDDVNKAPIMLRGKQGINLHFYNEGNLQEKLKIFFNSLKKLV